MKQNAHIKLNQKSPTNTKTSNLLMNTPSKEGRISTDINKFSPSNKEIQKIKMPKGTDYFSMFTKALLQNEDSLVNQQKCVDVLLKAKLEEESKRYKNHLRDKLIHLQSKETSVQEDEENEENSQIQEIKQQKGKNEKLLGMLFGANSNTAQNNNNKEALHHSPNASMSKSPKRRASQIKQDELNAKQDIQQVKLSQIDIKKRRRKILQHSLTYFESNSLFLSDALAKNPFQSCPFELPYSTEFLDAVKFGNHELVKQALQMNMHFLFSFDYYRQTAYHWAAKLGDYKMLNLLISNGKYINQYDKHNRTPLYIAVLNNQLECCQLILNNHGNAFLADKDGKRPVDIATDPKITILLNNHMDNPYFNPIVRSKMTSVFKLIDEKKMRKAFEGKAMREAKEIKSKIDSISPSHSNMPSQSFNNKN